MAEQKTIDAAFAEDEQFIDPEAETPPTAEAIDNEVKRLLDNAYAEAERIIRENRDNVENITQALLKYETLSGEEINAIIRGESIERSSVSDLLDKAAENDRVMARPVQSDSSTQTDLGGGALPQPG